MYRKNDWQPDGDLFERIENSGKRFAIINAGRPVQGQQRVVFISNSEFSADPRVLRTFQISE